jgi:hypothetical protein
MSDNPSPVVEHGEGFPEETVEDRAEVARLRAENVKPEEGATK